MDLTTYNRQQKTLLDEIIPSTQAQTRKVDDAIGHKFKIGDSVCLFGMKYYPEFNGEIVTIVAFREPDPRLSYYIESQNDDLSDQLNFIYENRMIK